MTAAKRQAHIVGPMGPIWKALAQTLDEGGDPREAIEGALLTALRAGDKHGFSAAVLACEISARNHGVVLDLLEVDDVRKIFAELEGKD